MSHYNILSPATTTSPPRVTSTASTFLETCSVRPSSHPATPTPSRASSTASTFLEPFGEYPRPKCMDPYWDVEPTVNGLTREYFEMNEDDFEQFMENLGLKMPPEKSRFEIYR